MSTVTSEVVKKIPTPAQIGNVKYRFKKPNNGWGKYYEKLKEIAKALGKELSDFHPSTGPALIPIPEEENVFRFKRMAGMWNLKTGAVSEPMVKISGEDIVDFALEFEQLDSTLNSLDEFVKTAMQLNVSHGFFLFNDETQTYDVRDTYYFKPAPPKIIDVKTLDLAALRKCFSEFINTDAMQITVKSSSTYLSIPREEAFKFVLAKRDKAAGADSKGDAKSGHEAITVAFNAKNEDDRLTTPIKRLPDPVPPLIPFGIEYGDELPPKKEEIEKEIVKLLNAYGATEKSSKPKP